MEATLFTGWIYDLLKPLDQELKVAHPPMLKAIAVAKKKNDKVDARMIADLLRCNLLPQCYMAPVAMRDLRRVLRYRNLVVRQATRMKNRIAGLLMETGTAYNKQRLRTLQGIEAVHKIRKGRVRWVAKGDAVAQSRFIAELFGIAA